jgi:putative PIN family toxin of toxin-antitoxin system
LDDQFTLVISEPVFEEYSQILLTHPIVPHDKAESFLDGLSELAQLVTISETLDVCRDPGDNVFLETAVVGKADYIVTKNTRHFPFKKYEEVEIVRVARFLSRLEREFG